MSFLRKPRDKRHGKAAHHRSKRQERELAKTFGGKITKASGATDMEKGDVRRFGVVRIEAKTTSRKSFSVTREMVQKIKEAALTSSRAEMPAMVIEFLDEDGKPELSVALVTVPHLEDLTAQWR